jgi:2-isopropylmalate synthase
VHAVFTAIDEIVKAPSELIEYSINAVTEGIDALGHASVRLRADTSDGRVNPQHGGSGQTQVFHGNAADSDVIVASTKAYLAALNRLLAMLGTYEKTDDAAPRVHVAN